LIFPTAPLLPELTFLQIETGVSLSFEDAKKLAIFFNDYQSFLKKYDIAIDYNYNK
jgi:hypothetical protein